jgi:hypothetical protein
MVPYLLSVVTWNIYFGANKAVAKSIMVFHRCIAIDGGDHQSK